MVVRIGVIDGASRRPQVRLTTNVHEQKVPRCIDAVVDREPIEDRTLDGAQIEHQFQSTCACCRVGPGL